MDNRKLLEIVLKDLNELEELIAEKGSNNFDELEWEFLQTRVSGAKRMIHILHDRESAGETEITAAAEVENSEPKQTLVQQKIKEEIIIEEKTEPKIEEEKVNQEEISEPEQLEEPAPEIAELEEPVEVVVEKETPIQQKEKINELGMDEEEKADDKRKILGDSFSKEKSVNDLIDLEKFNLEQKLSNRPVTSIKSAIGINDRFQFIRELFNGDPEIFSKTVNDLDAKNDIGEAVEYLQQNFNWKKNETSLKFVNLVKRRFLND